MFFDILIYPRDLVLTEYDWSIQSYPLICFSGILCHSEQVMGSLEKKHGGLLLRYPAFIGEYWSRMRFLQENLGQQH